MNKLIIYEKPTCTTCKKTIKLLEEINIPFEKINYYIKPFSKTKLLKLIKKMGLKPSELLRKNEKAYKDFQVKNKNYSEEQILDLMIKDPNLVQRPIVEFGDRVILARPAEKIRELFMEE